MDAVGLLPESALPHCPLPVKKESTRVAQPSLSLPCVPGGRPEARDRTRWRSRKSHIASPDTDEQAELRGLDGGRRKRPEDLMLAAVMKRGPPGPGSLSPELVCSAGQGLSR